MERQNALPVQERLMSNHMFNPLPLSCQKQPANFKKILQSKSKLGKYLKENRESEHY